VEGIQTSKLYLSNSTKTKREYKRREGYGSGNPNQSESYW